MAVLPSTFFLRHTEQVARELLGQWLCHRLADGRLIRGRITETEAYDGFEDRGSHAHRGMTARNAPMFGPPGWTYIYLCYGVHWMLNLTTRERGYPAAVLIRGVEGVSGPGRVTRHFQVGAAHNNQPLRRRRGLWVEAGDPIPDTEVLCTPRIGIDYAGPVWAAMPWRFVVRTGSSALPGGAHDQARGQRFAK